MVRVNFRLKKCIAEIAVKERCECVIGVFVWLVCANVSLPSLAAGPRPPIDNLTNPEQHPVVRLLRA